MTKRLVVLHSAEVAAMAFASAAAFMRSFGFFVLWLVLGLLSVAMYSYAYFFLRKNVLEGENASNTNNIAERDSDNTNSISRDSELKSTGSKKACDTENYDSCDNCDNYDNNVKNSYGSENDKSESAEENKVVALKRKKVELQNKQILNNYSNNLTNIITCFICGLIHVPWIYYYGIANGVLALVILCRVIKRPQGHPTDKSDF